MLTVAAATSAPGGVVSAWARRGLLLRALVVGLCYAAAYRAGFEFAVIGPDPVTALWLPNGFVVVLMLWTPRRRDWLAYVALVLVADWVVGSWMLGAYGLTGLGVGLGNCAESVITAALLRAGGLQRGLTSLRQVVYLGGAMVLAVTVNSAWSALVVWLTVPDFGVWGFAQLFWIGDAVGQLVVVPSLLALATADAVGPVRPDDGQGGLERRPYRLSTSVERVALAAVLLAVALGVFARPSGSALNVATGYFVVPVLATLAIRAGVRGAAYGSAALALLAAYFTARGRGPFAGLDENSHERIAQMQLFVVAATVMALLVAVLARRAAEEARASGVAEHRARTLEARFEKCIAGSRIGTAIVDPEGRFLQVNESYCRIVGRSAESLIGSHFSTVTRPEDLPGDAAAMQRLTSGELTYFEREKRYVLPDGPEVWGALSISVVRDLEGGVDLLFVQVVDITARVDAERRLSLQATHDHLTGLANRALMVELVTRAISRLERNKKPLAVLFLDLDRFKAVNDQRGHAAGDTVLLETARRMKAAVRPSDVVARYGGDEFVVLLEAIDSAEEVLRVARRLLASVQRPIADGDHRLDVTASIGIVISADPADDADRLIDRADIAMYRAKQSSPGQVAVFDDASFAGLLARRTLGDDLRHALARDEFLVHFQPIVDMVTREVVALEALLRWNHPERGILSAVDFFDQAPDNVDADALAAWVIDQAVGAIAQHGAHDGGAPSAVFVNASPQQFTERLVRHLAEALARYGVPGASVCVEMTESGLFEDDAHLAVIEKLRALGCRLALDDFGTGHSSLSRLATYPIDVVKIDQSFVDGFGTRDVDTAIVKSVIGLARVLGRDVIAEGVETAEQAARLVEAGCRYGQGYFFGAPAELVPPAPASPTPA